MHMFRKPTSIKNRVPWEIQICRCAWWVGSFTLLPCSSATVILRGNKNITKNQISERAEIEILKTTSREI